MRLLRLLYCSTCTILQQMFAAVVVVLQYWHNTSADEANVFVLQ